MSRAFVKEADGDAVQDDTPDIPISRHPNYVTPAGLAALEQERDTLLEQRASLKGADDPVSVKLTLFQVERRLRYVLARIDSAILKRPDPSKADTVEFGASVTVADEDDADHVFQIVGEDEADIKTGKVSYVSPLAKALLGSEVGDLVRWRRPNGDKELEVVAFAYPE